MRASIIMLCLVLSTGCVFRHGGRDVHYVPEDQPFRGALVRVDLLPRGETSGRLLSVDSAGFLLLASPEDLVTRVAWEVTRAVDFVDVPGPTLGRNPTETARATAATFARFPYGLDATAVRALLAAHGQQTIRMIPEPQQEQEAHAHAHEGMLHSDAHAHAPTGPSAPDLLEFVTSVREQSARFSDPVAAAREGYRRLGPDFPGMGQHWFHPAHVVRGDMNPGRPPVLNYAPVDGKPTLVGVAFTVALNVGEMPPVVFGSSGVWHDHAGSVDEEGLFLDHFASNRPGAESEPRVAMVHVWLTPNPGGPLAQNNWTLPFARLGIEEPPHYSVTAARALSLASNDPEYYVQLFESAAQLEEGDRAVVRTAIGEHAKRANAWAALARASSVVETNALDEVWRSLWLDLERGLTPAAWTSIRRFAGG
jgi:hypothetical protein